jgi:K+-transporting ATPase ATPase C chain
MKALLMFIWLTLLTGVFYPLLIWGIAQITMQEKAEGSMIKNVGSSLIAQKFTSDRYFWPRPSANDYNALSSGGSNLGPISPELQKQVAERKAKGLFGELLYASASGLDPHISPQTAFLQIDRIAKARGKDQNVIQALVQKHVERSIFGPPCVNVLKLNIELDQL